METPAPTKTSHDRCSRPKCPNKARARTFCDKHRKALTPTGFVDSAVVREHLELLHARGASWRELAEQLDMTREGLAAVRAGTQVQALTRTKVLRLQTPDTLGGGGLIGTTGTRRRIGALMAIGYSQKSIAEAAGLLLANVNRIFVGPIITGDTAAAVDKVYQQRQFTPGPSVRAKNWAAKRGYPPPLAWDEDTIDDPAASPEQTSAKKTDWWDSYLEVCEFGMSPQEAAGRLNLPWSMVYARIRANEKRAAA